MATENNLEIVRQLTKAHSEGDEAQLLKILASDFVWHIMNIPESLNRAQYIEGVKMGMRAFSGLTFTSEDIIASDEKVVVRLRIEGVHTGEFQGIAPSGKKIDYTSIAIYRLAGDKIIEEWLSNDMPTMFAQLGVSPAQ